MKNEYINVSIDSKADMFKQAIHGANVTMNEKLDYTIFTIKYNILINHDVYCEAIIDKVFDLLGYKKIDVYEGTIVICAELAEYMTLNNTDVYMAYSKWDNDIIRVSDYVLDKLKEKLAYGEDVCPMTVFINYCQSHYNILNNQEY